MRPAFLFSCAVALAVSPAALAAGPIQPGSPAVRSVSDLLDRGHELRFEPGTTKLAQESLPFLDQLASALIKEPGVRLDIVVHTADNGDAKRDLALSKRRADVIKRTLVDKGVAEQRLLATGRGSDDPVAPNLTRVGRQRNERVELHRATPPGR